MDERDAAVFADTHWNQQRLAGLADRLDDTGDNAVSIHAPTTGDRLGTVPAGDHEDVETAATRCRQASREWRDWSHAERAAVFRQFADAVDGHREELLDLLQLETGKARRHAVEEVLDTVETAAYYAENVGAFLAAERRQGAVPLATSVRVHYDPVGVVGVITPWNYPLNLAMVDALPALLAGNGVVLKPDEKTPYTALRLAELLEDAGLPEDVLTIVTGEGGVVGPAVVDAVDYVAFTGSTETGRAVAERAGRNLVDCSLELGGKNPLVVLDDADPETAAEGAVQASFTNAGQLCLAAERIYVERPLFDAFLDAFVGETRALSLGATYDYGPDVGSLIGDQQLERVRDHVDDAVDRGASVVTGGRHRPDVGPYFYEPTILTDVPEDATAACEETFGPVVRVESVPSEAAAIERANDSPYGLNASVWTGDRERGRRVARDIDCGTVCVNDAYQLGWAAVDAPMGGVGDSGLGRRHGPEGIRRYTSQRTVAVSRLGPFGPPSFVPYGWFAEGLVVFSRLRRHLRRWIP